MIYDNPLGAMVGFLAGMILTIPPVSIGVFGLSSALVYPFTLVVVLLTTFLGAVVSQVIKDFL